MSLVVALGRATLFSCENNFTIIWCQHYLPQMNVHCTEKGTVVASFRKSTHKLLLVGHKTSLPMAGKVRPYPTVLHDKLRWSPDITRIFTLFIMSDLQLYELGGSIQKTLWQLCQLVVAEIPGEFRDQTGVWGCALHMLTKTRLATSEIAVLIIIYRTQSTNCSVKQDDYHINTQSKRPWALGNHCPKDWCNQALTQRN